MQSDALDPEQRRAVEATERAIAVLAGPGSGKTRVLAFRARHLLARGKTSNALLLTFTNKAASEMKARVVAVTPAMSKRVRAGTFHNFAMSVLRSHGTHVGIASDFDVLDELERTELAAAAAAAAGVPDHSQAWSRQRLRQRLPTADVAKFGAHFETMKRQEGTVDFDDLIVYVVQLFQQQPAIAQAYATKYEHILVDEFQDTNAAQFAMVFALAEHGSPNSTISVFADDDQAIFGFAGAETKNISRFCDDLQAQIYPLTTNYRCAEAIVQCANRLIHANRANGRAMKAVKENGTVVARVFDSMGAEAKVVCAEIEARIAAGTQAHDISVLVRNAYRAKALRVGLQDRGIPYSNWLAATYDTNEQRQLRICLAVARPTLTNRVCRNLCELLGIEGAPNAPTINAEAFLQAHRTTAGIESLLTVRRLAENGEKVSIIVREVANCIKTVYPDMAVAESLVAEILAFEAHDPEYSLDHLLADLALGGKGGAPTEGGGVKLATIHRTKGLQWPHVYLIGLEDGHLPDFRSTTDEAIREERRLCFVAVCRAEDSLTVTRIKESSGYLKAPSRFIGELGIHEVEG
jgi:DNA helicase II / ATP-dependent DNA helicase PcrA